MFPAAATAAIGFLAIAEPVVSALDLKDPSIDDRGRNFFPRLVIDLLYRCPGYLHVRAAFLLRKAFVVNEANGFILVDGQRDMGCTWLYTAGRCELLDLWQLADLAAFSWPWHSLTPFAIRPVAAGPGRRHRASRPQRFRLHPDRRLPPKLVQ